MSVVFTKKRGVPARLQQLSADDPAQPPSQEVVDVNSSDNASSDSPYDPQVYTAAGSELTPTAGSPLVIGTSVARSTASSALLIPFFAYLVLSDRLPGWARLFAGVAGAGLVLQRMDAVPMSGLAGCGCGCNGAPGGCQG